MIFAHKTALFVGISILFLLSKAQAAAPVAGSIVFASDLNGACDPPTGDFESPGALGAWTLNLGAKALVGFASAAISEATSPKSVLKNATVPGSLYEYESESKKWLAVKTTCLRFWYGSVGQDTGTMDVTVSGVSDDLTTRWNELGLKSQPYVYGEVRLRVDQQSNMLFLEPVLLFAAKTPDAGGFWRRTGPLKVAIQLTAVGGDHPFAVYAIDIPDVIDGAVLLRKKSAHGLASGWFSLPTPPAVEPKPSAGETRPPIGGHFSGVVTYSTGSSATLLAKSISDAFSEQKEGLLTALKPKTAAQVATANQAAVREAFDAVRTVLERQSLLEGAGANDKAKLELDLRRAQYDADLKLRAAGLPDKYGSPLP